MTAGYKIVTMLRDPTHKVVSALYWYAPKPLLTQKPWATFCGNWTVADVAKMVRMFEVDFRAPGTKVCE